MLVLMLTMAPDSVLMDWSGASMRVASANAGR